MVHYSLNKFFYCMRKKSVIFFIFLKYFVPKNAKWMHVDIAGVSYDEDNTLIKGATGVSILSLFDLIQSY